MSEHYGMVIGLRADKVEDYRQLHAAVWPDVLRMIKECHLQNYSIYLRRLDDGQHYLFSYFEYTGADFATDMARMAADPATQRWWSVCMPCQKPLDNRAPGEWWASMEEVFHLE
jgi:L-rhamnose mutarotase